MFEISILDQPTISLMGSSIFCYIHQDFILIAVDQNGRNILLGLEGH